MEVARGNQAADQAARRAALQNHDLIGLATLVPQTNLPETPSYTEGETLKAKSEGFQDHMGWFQKEGLLFLPGNLQWKLVMKSNHLILYRPLLLLPSIFPNIRVFSNESALRIGPLMRVKEESDKAS